MPFSQHTDDDHDEVIATSMDTTKPAFRPGNITFIRMQNFLTFTDTVFKPGPRMNLIIGPNGTGKSTIVSAVCIVFGGKPTILGRSPDLGSFVKFGTTEASIEAWLYEPKNPKSYISVKRVFNADGKGYFSLQGNRVRQSDIIEKVVSHYDIQLDNLSQFMPQEKIAEFTNHRPDELLKLAVRSLGGVDREDLYADLIEQDKNLENRTGTLKENDAQLATLREQQENDEAEVQAFKAQRDLKNKLTVLEAFRPIVAEIELRATYSKIRDEMKAVDVQITQIDATMQTKSSGPINACKQKLEKAKQAYTAAKSVIQSAEVANDDNLTSTLKISRQFNEATKSMKDVEESAEKMHLAVESARHKLERAKEDFNNTANMSEEELDNQYNKLETRRCEFRSRKRDEELKRAPLDQDKSTASRAVRHFQNRLAGLGNVRQQRLAFLAKSEYSAKTLECERLVQDMRSKGAFEKRVYGPVLMEIEVRNAYHARIMEHCLGAYLMHGFVMESARDSRTLLQACRQHLNKWVPDTFTVPTNRHDEVDVSAIQAQRARRPVDDKLRQLGIDCTVPDIYTAPDPVRAALNSQAMLHTIYVGNEQANQNQEALRYERHMTTWYTPDSRCQVSSSRYDSSARNLRVDTSFASINGDAFSGNIAEEERTREDLKRRIRTEEEKVNAVNNELVEIDREQVVLTSKMREMETQIREVMENRKARQSASEVVDRMQKHLIEIQARAHRKDIAKEKKQILQQTRQLEDDAVNTVVKLTGGLQRLHQAVDRLDETVVERACAERELASEEAVHVETLNMLKLKKAERDSLKQDRDKVKREWRKKKEESENALTDEQAQEYEEELKSYYEKTGEDLEMDISNLEGEIEGIATGGAGVLEAYEHRKRRINRLEEEIEKHRTQFERQEEDLKHRKSEFLMWLQAGIERMRYKFSNLYSRLGCSGDLRLTNLESGSLGDLTLQVLVSYRNDVELRPVSAMANSGGEKMCCTMIFCFSMQLEDERIPPFVMVDELNQGLDPSNEMKIMTMMIEDASKQSASQSFVITPKLLPDLPLGTFTKTHIIFNGPVKGKEDFLASS